MKLTFRQRRLDVAGLSTLDARRRKGEVADGDAQIQSVLTGLTGLEELAKSIPAERRHRHNQQVSEIRRLDFPRLGHFDTWRVDVIQNFQTSHPTLSWVDQCQ